MTTSRALARWKLEQSAQSLRQPARLIDIVSFVWQTFDVISYWWFIYIIYIMHLKIANKFTIVLPLLQLQSEGAAKPPTAGLGE